LKTELQGKRQLMKTSDYLNKERKIFMTKTKINLQLFAAEANLTKSADLEPAISIDHTSRITRTLKTFREVLGITEMQRMAAGTQIKIYKAEKKNWPAQVGEGETIPLTKIERKLAKTIELTLSKHRKSTPAEAIQKVGYNNAVNATDEVLIREIQKGIKSDFFTLINSGTGTASGTNFQTACANAWAELQILFEDEDVNAVYFVNSVDVADYLGKANITMQTAFGLSYISNFLGLGTVIVSPKVTAGKVVATAKENLYGAYIPTDGDVAAAFGMTSDETGLIMMKHSVKDDKASLETIAMDGVKFYPERLDGVVISSITPPVTSPSTSQENASGQNESQT